MTSYKLVSVLLTILLISSCSLKVEEEKADEKSSQAIILDNLSISSVQKIYENSQSINRPTHKSFLVKACLKETVLLEPIRLQNFLVGAKQIKSDSNGCLHWSEKAPMSSSMENRYIRFSKKLVSLGSSRGEIKIEYAFNLYTDTFVNLALERLPEDAFQTTAKDELKVDFDMTDLTIYFGGYDSAHDDSRTEKKVISKWIGCFKYKADMNSLSNQIVEMKVVDEDGEVVQEVVNKTDLKGCLRANIYTEYDQFQPIRWIPRKLVVKVVEGPLASQVLERQIYINPWVNGRNHGWDSRAGEPPSNPVGEKAKLFIDNVRYTFLGNREDGYKVNKFLDLSVTKSYLIELRPKIDRGHSFSTNRIIEDIYTGRFRLRIGVLGANKEVAELTAESASKYRYITGIEKEVEVVNNKIITSIDLPFRFEDLAESSARTVAVIELSPLSNDTNLQSVVVSGNFLASSHQLSVGLRPHNNNLDVQSELNISNLLLAQKLDHITKNDDPNQELESNWKGSTTELFKVLQKDNQLKQEPILTLTTLSKKESETLVGSKANLQIKRKLCESFYPKKKISGIIFDSYSHPIEYSDCTRDPDKHLLITKHKHIQNIIGKTQKLYTSTDKISIGTGFLVYDGKSRRTSRAKRISFGGSISGSIEIPFLKILSLGVGANADISKMWSRDHTTGTTSRAQFSRSRNLFVDEIKLGFNANLHNCVLIQGRPYEESSGGWLNSSTVQKHNKKRFQLCSSSPSEEWVEESWFYIGEQKPSHSILRDPWSISENYLGKIIRGKSNYENFYNLMTDDTKVIFLEKVETMQGNDKYIQSFYKPKERAILKDMAIPGTINQDI